MALALVLNKDGRRVNCRWKRDSIPLEHLPDQAVGSARNRMKKAGVVLDYAPSLAMRVVSGDLALGAAFLVAELNRPADQLSSAS